MHMTGQDKFVVSVPETAKLLGISRALAYELVARNEIPAIRLGRRIVVPLQAIEALLRNAGNAA
jgi:excisionase family DNA binding protein